MQIFRQNVYREKIAALATLTLTLALSLTGCVGPLVLHETARTVGDGNSELIGGGGNGGFVFKYNYGLFDRLDVGVQWESLSLGIRAKLGIINPHGPGWSWAIAAGIGDSVGGSHYYGDLITSYLTGSFEPYGALRVVHVNIDSQDFKSDVSDQTIFTTPSTSFNYEELIVGSRIWFTPHWLLSLEAGTVFAVGSGVSFDNNFLIGAAFGYHFGT
jgi:hypothetical protein